MIPYGKQHITQEDIDAVISALKSDFITQGPKIAEFEAAFAHYVGSSYAVAVSNGTAALHLAALALGLKEGQKVITTPLTFAASANCIEYCSGTVLFADINPDTFTINPESIEEICKQHTDVVGIIPVDFAGHPADAEKLHAIAKTYNLWILEDACHAPGAYFIDSKGVKQFCGNNTYADASIFSFHPVKHIATGEGGMITTNNIELYEKLYMLRTHGITKNPAVMTENHGGWYYQMQELGFNYRITDFQSALGLSQLSRADQGLARRNELANRYTEAFKNSCVTTPQTRANTYHAYHLYVVSVPERKALYDYLRTKEIYTQVHYIPLYTMPYYKQKGYSANTYPVTEAYYERCLSLPMYPGLTNKEQDYVITSIKEFYQSND